MDNFIRKNINLSTGNGTAHLLRESPNEIWERSSSQLNLCRRTQSKSIKKSLSHTEVVVVIHSHLKHEGFNWKNEPRPWWAGRKSVSHVELGGDGTGRWQKE